MHAVPPLHAVIPVLPSRDFNATAAWYAHYGFAERSRYPEYLILAMGAFELHFFRHPLLDPNENDGGAYFRVGDIERWNSLALAHGSVHPNGPLADKPWGQRELSLLDPDKNLLRLGQPL